MKPVFIVDLFRDVVEKVSAKLSADLIAYDPNITGVHYQHGHPLEIVQKLNERDKAESFIFKKYPLIALFQDFPENKGQLGFESDVTLHLIIARFTEASYQAEERYDKNFKPVLYPIYMELMEQLNRHRAFTTKSVQQIQHTKTDRLYWGREGLWKNEGNVFNDFIDCIEIRDLKLKVNLKNC